MAETHNKVKNMEDVWLSALCIQTTRTFLSHVTWICTKPPVQTITNTYLVAGFSHVCLCFSSWSSSCVNSSPTFPLMHCTMVCSRRNSINVALSIYALWLFFLAVSLHANKQLMSIQQGSSLRANWTLSQDLCKMISLFQMEPSLTWTLCTV